ncbi:MAG: glycoside hydrolase family 10 protein [Kiritimatiellia bacterium]
MRAIRLLARLCAVLFLAPVGLTGCERGAEIPPPPVGAGEVFPSFAQMTASSESVRKVFRSPRARRLAPGAVALAVDFKDRPSRVTWDIPLTADLKARRGVQFDFFCTDLTQFRSFSFYFKSGEGWYHGTFAPEEDGAWTRLTVNKSECRTEGRPAGWGKIEAVRISGWRAGAGRATCAFANLVPLGGDPEVLVVYAESMRAQDAATARDSMTFGGRVVSSLTALGLESALVADTDFSDELMRTAQTLVFPYNPGFPREKEALLRRYAARGGRFLACYRLSASLATLLGVKTRGVVRPTDRGGAAIGGFRRVGRGLVGQPDFAPQASWMTQVVVREPTVEVVAEWATGRTGEGSGYPALVRTSKGLFMSHVWLGGTSGESLALMQAIIGDLAPSLAPGMSRRMRRLADEQAARAAWLKGRTSRRGELRAIWCHDARGLGGGRDWDASVKFLRDNGFNAVLPNLAWAGTAFYKSSVLPVDASVAVRGDALAQCLQACRTYGVQCHVWKVCWNMGAYATKDFERRMVAAHRVQVNDRGEKKTRWLCPSHPANQRLEIAAMVELAKKGPDGIHFDYIRYPDGGHCFCDGCRRRFEARLGHTVTNWPAALRGENVPEELKTAWKDFRTANITAVVKAVAERVRRECPGVKISAATYRNAATDPCEIGQDWGVWCRAGWLDFVCPMDYEDSAAMFRSQVKLQKETVGKAKLYPGIGLSCFRSDGAEAVRLARQIEVVRELGLDGFTVFNLDRTAERVLPQLRAGITRED